MNHLITFHRYGDYGDKETTGGAGATVAQMSSTEWPLWEVFIRST